jgi:hypothetical protein
MRHCPRALYESAYNAYNYTLIAALLQWDRQYLALLGVANKRLYQLRLQTSTATYEKDEVRRAQPSWPQEFLELVALGAGGSVVLTASLPVSLHVHLPSGQRPPGHAVPRE